MKVPLTVITSLNAPRAAEVWKGCGTTHKPGVFVQEEIPFAQSIAAFPIKRKPTVVPTFLEKNEVR